MEKARAFLREFKALPLDALAPADALAQVCGETSRNLT